MSDPFKHLREALDDLSQERQHLSESISDLERQLDEIEQQLVGAELGERVRLKESPAFGTGIYIARISDDSFLGHVSFNFHHAYRAVDARVNVFGETYVTKTIPLEGGMLIDDFGTMVREEIATILWENFLLKLE